MSSTPLIESPDQTPEQGDGVPYPMPTVNTALEQVFDSRKQACDSACEKTHQQDGSDMPEPHNVYYELVGNAHSQGFRAQDEADSRLRGTPPDREGYTPSEDSASR